MKLCELRDLLRQDYVMNNRALAKGGLCHYDHILRHFNGAAAQDITPTKIEWYKSERLREGAARATINNELAQLRRSMNLAVEMELLPRAPKVKMLRVDNARQGFLMPGDFRRLIQTLEVLDQVVADIVTWLYSLGWRRDEARFMPWSEVHLDSGRVQLPGDRTKEREPRLIGVGADLHALLRRRWEIRNGDLVFHRDGKPVQDFRGTWDRAVKAIGQPDLHVHDLRRSFARNALQAGVPQKTIMDIAGWKTMNTFLRYCIRDEGAMGNAIDQVGEYVKTGGRPGKPHPRGRRRSD